VLDPEGDDGRGTAGGADAEEAAPPEGLGAGEVDGEGAELAPVTGPSADPLPALPGLAAAPPTGPRLEPGGGRLALKLSSLGDLSMPEYWADPAVRSASIWATARMSGTGSQRSNFPANPARRISWRSRPGGWLDTVASQQSVGELPGRRTIGASGTTSSVRWPSSGVSVT